MEALVLIFGDLVFALLAPILVVIAEMLGVMGAGVCSLPGKTPIGTGSARVLRYIAVALVVLVMITVSAAWVVDRYYFAPTVRYLFGTMEPRLGIVASCERIEGSLFAGKIGLDDCHLQREEHEALSFELSVERMALDVRLASVLSTAVIDVAEVKGIDGWIRREHAAHEEADDGPAVEKPRRAFVVRDLAIDDVTLLLSGKNTDGEEFEMPVAIHHLHSAPMRSRLALFDTLFRSNAEGTIAGARFEMKTSATEGGRQTSWQADDVPVADFGAMVGGSLAWFKEGSVDVSVKDEWVKDGNVEIDMDWKLDFHGLKVAAPNSAGLLTRTISKPLTDYVNQHGGEFPMAFQMTVNEDQFEYQGSLAASGIWEAVGDSVNTALKVLGVDLEMDGENTGNRLKEGAKSVLDRLRKPKPKKRPRTDAPTHIT